MEARKIYGLITGKISSENFWYNMNHIGENNELVQALATQLEKANEKNKHYHDHIKYLAIRLIKLNVGVERSREIDRIIVQLMDTQEIIAYKVKNRIPLSEREIDWLQKGSPEEGKQNVYLGGYDNDNNKNNANSNIYLP